MRRQAFRDLQASEMGCVHPGRASDGEEYSDAASDEWDRGFADDPAARHQGANGAAAHRDANGAVGAPGDGAHLVAGAGSRPGSADSAHLLSSAAADSPGAAAARAAAEAAEVGPQVDPEPLVAGAKHRLRLFMPQAESSLPGKRTACCSP